ncbi:MAG: hypothetical protein WC695_08200 [Candidatus Omnitrophota bacterium]
MDDKKYPFCGKRCLKAYSERSTRSRETEKNECKVGFDKRTKLPPEINECNVDFDGRIQFFECLLNKLLILEEGSFLIIEHIDTGKFVQLMASSQAKQLLLDIPIKKQGLSKEQFGKLSTLIEFSEGSVELFSDDPYQVSFVDVDDYPARILHKIWDQVFNLSSQSKFKITFSSFY